MPSPLVPHVPVVPIGPCAAGGEPMDAEVPEVAPASPRVLGAPALAVLVAGCAVAGAIGLLAVGSAAAEGVDPELARLLRGMAAIKVVLVAGGVAILGWRLRFPLPPRLLWGYLACAFAASLATGLVWQLAHLRLAAVLFHGALIGGLLLAWRDGGEGLSRLGRGSGVSSRRRS